MANYIISYDLNGPRPSHQGMDELLGRTGTNRGRLLETVWWVAFAGEPHQLHSHLRSILGPEDRLLVVLAADAAFSNLLVADQALIQAWQANR